MKNFLLCLTVLLLTSCIPVGDFGAYWDKGAVDPALLGKWVEIAREPKDEDPSGSVRISEKNGAYEIDSLDKAERRKKDYEPVEARTLIAGPYTFLMMKDDDKKTGDIIRYKIEGDVFQEYSLNPQPAEKWLKKHYPRVKNIKRPPCKPKCLYDQIRIVKLDDSVYKALSEIPDTKAFWVPAGSYRRDVGKPQKLRVPPRYNE